MSVMDAARNLAEDYPGGAAALALRIDKNPSSFSHELHEAGIAKLGLVTAVKMTRRTGDRRILNAFAAEAGCMVLPLPEALAVEGDDAMQMVSDLAREFNDVVQAFVGAVADRDVNGNEMVGIRRQWSELQLVGQRLVGYAESLHEAGKPAHLRAVEGVHDKPAQAR
jgi:hypothetical protein